MNSLVRDVFRICFAVLVCLGCYQLILDSSMRGAARLFCTLAIIQSWIEPADQAVTFSPKDPEAHYTRALTLLNLDRLDEAVTELEQSIRCPPQHDYEWLEPPVTLDPL